MTNKQSGWLLALASLGMMLGLMALDVSKIQTWHEVYQPSFIAQLMAHVATVITAFIGGKLIPTEPTNQRKDDE